MKKHLVILLLALAPFASFAQFGMEAPEESDKISGGAQMGAISADGKNYQQAGFRIDVPIGKFGIGLDVQLLFDENGKIRVEDWNEWEDYLDKIYFLRYGKKNKDPFYVKMGSLNYSTIGYGNIVDNYTNMIEYPTYKRWGGELAFKGEKFGLELLMNNFKEVAMDNPGMMIASRLSYRPLKRLEVGVSVAADFNEYNGLRDSDGDGYPDRVDEYINDADWVTEYELRRDAFLEADPTITEETIKNIIRGENTRSKENNVTIHTKDDLFNINDNTSTSLIYGADIGYSLIENKAMKLKIFSHATQINGYGWGIALPGIRYSLGSWLQLGAEYRRTSDEFVFGYVNSTYDTERAFFIDQINETTGEVTGSTIMTKQQSLAGLNNALNGYFVSADLNLGNIISAKIEYQDLIGANSQHVRTLRGQAGLQADFIPMIKSLNAYYLQNNVQDFKQWKTPSTVMGLVFDYEVGGVVMGLDYRLTFQDRDGNGLISGDKETITTMSFRTRVDF